MTRLATLVLLFTVILCVSTDQIVPKAFQQIFPNAAAAKVKTLTTNVNKQTTAAKAKEVIKKWIPANAAQVSIMMFNPNNNPNAALQKKAFAFINYRFSLKKYVNYLYNQAVATKYLTMSEADTMRTMFWTCDKKAANNYTVTSETFITEASAKIIKTPSIKDSVTDLTGKFAKANPKDYKNLQWTL
ncbi:unnamed protein product [Caenorhabditis brenneri]